MKQGVEAGGGEDARHVECGKVWGGEGWVVSYTLVIGPSVYEDEDENKEG